MLKELQKLHLTTNLLGYMVGYKKISFKFKKKREREKEHCARMACFWHHLLVFLTSSCPVILLEVGFLGGDLRAFIRTFPLSLARASTCTADPLATLPLSLASLLRVTLQLGAGATSL